MKKNKVIWFTQGANTIGILLCTNEMGEKKAYLGGVLGHDEEQDVQHLMQLGAKLHPSQAQEIHDHFFPAETESDQ